MVAALTFIGLAVLALLGIAAAVAVVFVALVLCLQDEPSRDFDQ